jgi:hypothetical protein
MAFRVLRLQVSLLQKPDPSRVMALTVSMDHDAVDVTAVQAQHSEVRCLAAIDAIETTEACFRLKVLERGFNRLFDLRATVPRENSSDRVDARRHVVGVHCDDPSKAHNLAGLYGADFLIFAIQPRRFHSAVGIGYTSRIEDRRRS